MKQVLALARTLERLNAFNGRTAGWLLLLLMGVIVFDVVMRRSFNVGSTMLQELEWHLHGALFLLSMGWAFARGAHVRIELISERLAARNRAWLEWLGCLVFLLPYAAALIYFGSDYLVLSFEYSERSASPTGLGARYIIKAVMVWGFVLLGLAGLARLLDVSVYLFGSETSQRASRFSRAQHNEPEGRS